MRAFLVWLFLVIALAVWIVTTEPLAPAMAEPIGVQPKLTSAVLWLPVPCNEPCEPCPSDVINEASDTTWDVVETRLMSAMYFWAPVKVHLANGEHEDEVRKRYETFAHSTMLVIFDANEPPLYRGDNARERTGLRLLAQGFVESSFSDYVLDGRCNDRAWRMTGIGQTMLRRGGCDDGVAYGMAQIHVNQNGGIVLTERGWLSGDEAKKRDPGVVPLMGNVIVTDAELYMRVLLHCIRTTPGMWSSASKAQEVAEYAYSWSRKERN